MSDWITTKQAMGLLGVGPTTIKRWADASILRAVRTVGGHRRFSRAEVERLLAQQTASATMSKDQWIGWLTENGDTNSIADEIRKLHDRFGDWLQVADFLGEVVQQIGVRCATGNCSVVVGHIASSRLDLALATVWSAFRVPPGAPTCVLATLDGERHALGLSLAQLCLRSAGLEVLWVGVDTPLDALVAYIRDAEPRLIGLSASKFSTDDHGVLGKSYRTIAAVCRARGIALILGGTGAWPEVIDYGYRCVSFADLRRVLATLDLQKEITN